MAPRRVFPARVKTGFIRPPYMTGPFMRDMVLCVPCSGIAAILSLTIPFSRYFLDTRYNRSAALTSFAEQFGESQLNEVETGPSGSNGSVSSWNQGSQRLEVQSQHRAKWGCLEPPFCCPDRCRTLSQNCSDVCAAREGWVRISTRPNVPVGEKWSVPVGRRRYRKVPRVVVGWRRFSRI